MDKSSSNLKPEKLAELLKVEIPSPKYLVNELIALGDLVILAGKPKTGKSFFCLQLAMSIDLGIPFLERDVIQARVLYIALEDGRNRIHRRCKSLDWSPNSAEILFELDAVLNKTVNAEQNGLRTISTLAKERELIIIDTLVAVLGSDAKENNNPQMGTLFKGLSKIAHDNDTAIIIVHHTGKGLHDDIFDSIRGASAIRGGYDTGLLLERRANNREGILHIESRDMESSQLRIMSAKDGIGWNLSENIREYHEIKAGKDVVRAMEKHGDGKTVKELSRILGLTPPAISSQLKNAAKHGYVKQEPGVSDGSRSRPPATWLLTTTYC